MDMLGITLKIYCGPVLEGIDPMLLVLSLITAAGIWLSLMLVTIYDACSPWLKALMNCYDNPCGVVLRMVNIIEWMNIRLGVIKLLHSEGAR